MSAVYREPDTARGKKHMQEVIDSVSASSRVLSEVITRTLRDAADVLALFDRPGTSNGPTKGINGRLEHLRDSALWLRDLSNTSRALPARNRRLQTPSTPSTVQSQKTSLCHSVGIFWLSAPSSEP
jgi:hypothetical protein